MKTILVVKPDENLEHDFAPEILKAEGLFHFEVLSQAEVEPSRLKDAAVVLTLRGVIEKRASGILMNYVRDGGRLPPATSNALSFPVGLTTTKTLSRSEEVRTVKVFHDESSAVKENEEGDGSSQAEELVWALGAAAFRSLH